jgi:hypothetical protein
MPQGPTVFWPYPCRATASNFRPADVIVLAVRPELDLSAQSLVQLYLALNVAINFVQLLVASRWRLRSCWDLACFGLGGGPSGEGFGSRSPVGLC